jgi:hypothetical protein
MDDHLLGGVTLYPNVRLPGRKCCIESIEANVLPTELGARLRCPVCQAVLIVDHAGAWTLAATPPGTPSARPGPQSSWRAGKGLAGTAAQKNGHGGTHA